VGKSVLVTIKKLPPRAFGDSSRGSGLLRGSQHFIVLSGSNEF